MQIKQADVQAKQQRAAMEAQIKQAEIQRKQQKDALDAAAKSDEIRLREMEIRARQELEGAKLGVDIQKEKRLMEQSSHDSSMKREIEGARLGIEIGKAKLAAESAQRKGNKE